MVNLASTSCNLSPAGNTSRKSSLSEKMSLLRDSLNKEVINGNLNSDNVLKISKELDSVLNEYNKICQNEYNITT